jgi:hypothetical protein
MIKRILTMSGMLFLGACYSESSTAPEELTPRFSSSTSQSFTVQAITSLDGAFWQGCTGTSLSTSSWSWNPSPGVTRTRVSYSYLLNGACQDPYRYYNGGWVYIYDLYNGQESLIGSVDANMVKKTITYDGPAQTFRLQAQPYSSQDGVTCYFVLFDGYPAGQSSITVTGSGDLPLAQFQCSST